MKTLQALLKLTGSQIYLFIAAIVTLAAGVIFEASGRFLIRDIVDTTLADTINRSAVVSLILAFIICTISQGVLYFLSGRWKTKTTERIARTIRERLFNHIQRLSFHYHDRTPVGELVQRATSDVDSVRRFYGEQIPGFLQIVFKFCIYFGTLCLISVKLAFAASAVMPLIAVISTFFFGRIYRAYDLHQKEEGKVSTVVQENLHGIRVVRAFAQQERENGFFDIQNQAQRRAGLGVVLWHSAYWPVAHILCGLQYTAALFTAGYMVLQGELTVGAMVAATFLFNGLIWPLQELGRLITEISHSFVSFIRIDEIFTENVEDDMISSLPEITGVKGAIAFKNVSLSYCNNAPVLKSISFECRAGEKIALLGETGSGKTSVINLLPRFYDYTGGEILLDGRPLTEYSRSFLRQNIGIVEQNPFLFTMTVRENIEYGVNRDVSFNQVVQAAQAASIHESIMSFPEQYDTVVGEKGVSLSGGQKQRIAIARTLLKDPGILILDDSTSAIDAETEQSIGKALADLLKGRTTFIIAHRINTLREADRILVLKDGNIVQSGTHDVLVAQDGFYRRIYEIQTQIQHDTNLDRERAG